MFRNLTHALCCMVLLSFACGLSGCATNTTAHRYYSGPPLPNNETALIFTIATYSNEHGGGGCQMDSIRGESEKAAKKLGYGPSVMIEVLPGQYIANFKLLYLRAGHRKYDEVAEIKLNVQAGNIYVIYPEIEGKDAKTKTTFSEFIWGKSTELGRNWRPVIVNINDYNDEDCSDSRYRLRCPDKDILRKKATKYLESERSTISYHPSNVIVVFSDGSNHQLDVGDVWE